MECQPVVRCRLDRERLMLIEYVEAAMRKAKYKLLDENEGFFAEIPGFRGVWANAKNLEACRDELQSVLESWLIIKLRHNDNDLPVVNGMNLNPRTRKRRKVA